MRLFVNNLRRQKTILILNDSSTLLLSSNGNYMEFIYVVWWFLETKAFCALPKKAKISKLQRLKIGLGMSNIELK